MKIQNFNKFAFGMVLALGFVVVPSLSNTMAVQAQDGRWERRRGGNNGQLDRNGNIDRNRNGVDDRYETNDGRVDRNRNGVADQNERRNGRNGSYRRNDGYNGGNDRYGRNYPNGRNDGYYDNGGYYGADGNYGNGGYNSSEFQKGYRDGLDRGRDDARTNRAMTPNNSSHYRKGNQAYRAGFERGFYEAYRQYSGRGW